VSFLGNFRLAAAIFSPYQPIIKWYWLARRCALAGTAWTCQVSMRNDYQEGVFRCNTIATGGHWENALILPNLQTFHIRLNRYFVFKSGGLQLYILIRQILARCH
jgi:hypothetical protein